jgi:toxin ParE1/3/4
VPGIELAPEVLDDFDRFFDHQTQHEIDDTPDRIADIIAAIQILAHSPLIGWRVAGGKRELVIGERSRGHVALYRFVPQVDTVFILAIRSQRERGYKQSR